MSDDKKVLIAVCSAVAAVLLVFGVAINADIRWREARLQRDAAHDAYLQQQPHEECPTCHGLGRILKRERFQ